MDKLEFLDFLIFSGVVQKFLDRLFQRRMDEVRVDFSQRDEDEFAVLDERMRDGEFPRLNLKVIEKKNVQIDRSRSPSKRFQTADAGFDLLQGMQKFRRLQFRLDFYYSI